MESSPAVLDLNLAKPPKAEVIVTAGGTRERIDDVRYVGNFSSGHLGQALAAEYAQAGYGVTLLAPNSVTQRFGLPDGVRQLPFTTARSLEGGLRSEFLGSALGEQSATKLILHAAAVSDYSPVCADGKLPSDEEELVVRMRRVPKILPQLRQIYGDETKIVGFKLMSGVSEDMLIATAVKQIRNCHTDLCVANDLQNIERDSRRVHIVQPDGNYNSFNGSTERIAAILSTIIEVERSCRV